MKILSVYVFCLPIYGVNIMHLIHSLENVCAFLKVNSFKGLKEDSKQNISVTKALFFYFPFLLLWMNSLCSSINQSFHRHTGLWLLNPIQEHSSSSLPHPPPPAPEEGDLWYLDQIQLTSVYPQTNKNGLYIFYISGEQTFKKKEYLWYAKIRNSNLSAPNPWLSQQVKLLWKFLSVYSQFLSYPEALLPALHGELCFRAPCLLWLRSSPWSEEAAGQRSAHPPGRENPGGHVLGSLDSGVTTGWLQAHVQGLCEALPQLHPSPQVSL